MTKQTRVLGKQGPASAPIGLGCMGMSGMYGKTDDAESIKTVQEAIDRGINLIDTGDFYGMGHNEWLLRTALEGRRDKAVVSVKFGALRGPDGSWLGFDARPAALANFLTYSLQRLGIEAVDIYRPARLDPQVPIEDTVGAISRLIEKGYVKHIGLSEVGPETIRRANAVHPIADLQIEYSLVSRKPEEQIFPVLEELGISATLYGVLSRGLLSGKKPSGDPKDFRAYLPRFSEDNAEQNNQVVERLASFAKDRGQSPAQLALAWAIAKQPKFVALLGAKTRVQLNDGLLALEKPLSANEVDELEKLIPKDAIQGTRYGAEQMVHLDSEH